MESVRNIKKFDFWKQNTDLEKITFLLGYAILAPSYYNSQPWLFKISDNKCKFYLNPKIKLKEGDSEERNLHMSLGCAIENIIIASRYFGVLGKIDTLLENGKYIGTEITFDFKKLLSDSENNLQLDKEYEKLVDYIPFRQNAKGSFKNTPIPADIISRLSMFAFLDDFSGLRIDFLTNREQIITLGNIVVSGIKQKFKNKLYRVELSVWLHNNFRAKKEGLLINSQNSLSLLSMIISYLIPYMNVGSFFAKADLKSFKTAPVACVIGGWEEQVPVLSSDSNKSLKTKPETWVNAGRLTQRLLLEFAARGYNTSIFSSATESGNTFKEIQKLVGMTERPELIFCVGQINKGHKFTSRFEAKEKIESKI
ncbi:MAG: hypothetical protein Q8L47_04155 [bacterium]|nr:hypothetical protein [bacterium]